MVQFNDKFVNSRSSELRRHEEEKLMADLAPRFGLPYIDLHGYTINPEAVILYPENKARAARLIVFEVKHNQIFVATQTPQNPLVEEAVRSLTNDRQTVSLYLCSLASLEHGWKRYADVVHANAEKKGVFDIDSEEIISFSKKITQKTDVTKELEKIQTINNSRRVSETLEIMFAGALGLRASDIHIEPEEAGVRLRYRLDGVLHNISTLDQYLYARIMSRLKLRSGMTLNKKAEAQDGRFTFEVGEKVIDVRSSIIPGALGESIVMRLLDSTVASYTLDKIQVDDYLRKIIENELKKPNGLIITTGPTGSGKTTALYAFLRQVHTEGTKIITIENPVEYKIEGIVQTQVSEDYSFSTGLRAILRQDPDVILVGEIRDREVAETAIHAAQTGHLVFSTLHANNAAAAFTRLIDLGIDPRVFGSSINAILGQRLVRKLCEECKTSYLADQIESNLIHSIVKNHPKGLEVSDPITLHKAVGCPACAGTGYKGRVGVFEAILMDDQVEEAAIRDPREHIILEAAAPQKIPTMLEDGIEKVLKGVTDLAELERVVEIPLLNKKATPEENDDTDLFLSHVVN
jgi:type II secretory ATPase GspE/PulE/Tfp pilus assembly ATPase PilB-like protein